MHEAYQLAFDEINALGFSDMSRDQIEDEFETLLILAYTLGVEEAGLMLHKKIEAELDEMEDIIWAEIAGKTFADRIDDHLEKEDDGLAMLARSEFSRVYNTALFKSGKRSGASMKTWVTVGDERVRETHDYLEGVTVGIDDYFWTFDGDHALRPYGFQRVENNANCRCSLLIR